ncbi:MAG: ATP-binding protein [Polyangia bacterium]
MRGSDSSTAQTQRAPEAQRLPEQRGRWELWGLFIGLGSGLFDLGLFWLLGDRLHLGPRTSIAVVTGLFALTSAVLGYAIGRLLVLRRREQEATRIISAQLGALAESQRQVLENEKLAAIGRLAAGIAHEVRNPLGVIRASAKMVQEGFSAGEDPHRACQFICEEIDRLNGLIGSLLTFARPQPLRLSRIGLDAVLERALQLIDDELRRRGVRLARPGASGLELLADADLLAQVVFSLLNNAAEALGQGGTIELRTFASPAELRIEVADSGPGLLPEHAQRLFEPFFTTKPTGTGLGLAMAQRIVQAHRGGLRFLPSRGAGPLGSGACFEIFLPRGEPAVAVAVEEQA